MGLDSNKNYIVSGLERSGTSMLMQILWAGGAPVAFDSESRPPDQNNPKGYFELEGGKIINRLEEGVFPLSDYKGKVIKITAYGLKFLPPGNYKIIYSQRNIEELLDSMEKMSDVQDGSREESRRLFLALNEMMRDYVRSRDDVEVLFVDYNSIIADPSTQIREIYSFLGSPELDFDKMVAAVDVKLYRKRRIKSQ